MTKKISPKKKKEIDTPMINGLYINSIWAIREAYQREIIGHSTLRKLSEQKNKFARLKDRYEFNEYNEKAFNEKTVRIIDFEEQLKKDLRSLNSHIQVTMELNDRETFAIDETL